MLRYSINYPQPQVKQYTCVTCMLHVCGSRDRYGVGDTIMWIS